MFNTKTDFENKNFGITSEFAKNTKATNLY